MNDFTNPGHLASYDPHHEWRYRMIASNVGISSAAWTAPTQTVLTPEAVGLLASMHRQFDERRRALLSTRRARQADWDRGNLPGYEPRDSEAVAGSWQVAPVPGDLRTRRVEITGPVNSAKMVINMLCRNSDGVRADTAMLDFEDSMKPSWANVIQGVHHVIGAARGTLRLATSEKIYRIEPADMPVILVRCRGLHLDEANFMVDGQAISAGLFDLALCLIHTGKTLLAQGKTPAYYIPKTEHYLEARWWNDLFVALQHALGLPSGSLRATFLIETLPAAFQLEEILYEIRAHAAGLNVGRWDKIFSDIKILKEHPDRIMPDRATITMQKPWMNNYAKRLIKVCHERGAYAIGGMSAFIPGKTAQLRMAQTAKVAEDKAHECSIGHDGCWVSHPYFITHALAQFPRAHQTDRRMAGYDRYPDLLPRGEGPYTIEGLRTNVRVGIGYQHGWNQDIGCVAWDNLMEDLATFEISRVQVWQWVRHGVALKDGRAVTHDLVKQVFEEELARISLEVKSEMARADAKAVEMAIRRFRRAARDAERTFLLAQLPEYLSLASDVFGS